MKQSADPRRTRVASGALLLLAAVAGAEARAQTAFRFSDLDLRDPHVFVNFLGCRDVTDTPLVGFSVNGELQTLIQTDGSQPPDGLLDLSYVIEFLPLNQSAPTNLMDTLSPSCTAPLAGTSCAPPATTLESPATHNWPLTGQCLAPLVGTIRPVYACHHQPRRPLLRFAGGHGDAQPGWHPADAARCAGCRDLCRRPGWQPRQRAAQRIHQREPTPTRPSSPRPCH